MVGRAAAISLATLCACATPEQALEAYNPVSAGMQTMTVSSYEQGIPRPVPPYYVTSTNAEVAPLKGATCTLRTDKGSWTVTTPGKVAVAVGGPLHVECTKPGYPAVKARIPCTNPKVRGAAEGAMTVMTILGPVGAVAAAIAAPAALAGAVAAGAAVGGEAESRAAGAEGNEAGCDYQYTALGIRFPRPD